jgi:hypothetical protein
MKIDSLPIKTPLNMVFTYRCNASANKAPKFAGYAGGTAKPLRFLAAPWLKRYV